MYEHVPRPDARPLANRGRLARMAPAILMLAACAGPDADVDAAAVGQKGAAPEAAETMASDLQFQNVWARPAMVDGDMAAGGMQGHGGARNSAVYLDIHNPGPDADRLVNAASDAARAVEIHRTQVEDGVMRMRRLEDGIALEPGQTVELRPGGLHVMLIGVTRSLVPGDRFTVTLAFERAGEIELDVEVRERP